jgi:MoxR-like ATPase
MLRLRVACHLPRLDAELAAGISPWRSDEHALRAAQLVARRRRYARDLKRAAECRGAGVPVCRAAVLDARPALLALADDLMEVPDPSPRGVALALRLLVDGGGPLYRPWRASDLYAAAEEARHAL